MKRLPKCIKIFVFCASVIVLRKKISANLLHSQVPLLVVELLIGEDHTVLIAPKFCDHTSTLLLRTVRTPPDAT